jgi:hypothetical protein
MGMSGMNKSNHQERKEANMEDSYVVVSSGGHYADACQIKGLCGRGTASCRKFQCLEQVV